MNKQARVGLMCVGLLLWAAESRVSAADEPHGYPGRPETRPDTARPVAARPPGAVPAARPSPGARPLPGARPSFDGRGQLLDARYNHGRYYPPVGTVAPALPAGYRPYYHGGQRYYFNGGVWYAPRAGGFLVITPPVGLVISVLPTYYSTVWVGGAPYYYADNVYYTWQPDQNGYAVVTPPGDVDQSSPPPDNGDASAAGASAQPDYIIYPKNGQSKDQQAADEYECHNWARGQTGFDPSQPGGGVAADDADRSHSNYDRAMSACLQGRGYQLN
jgi:Family of unknown function (DUF6515)